MTDDALFDVPAGEQVAPVVPAERVSADRRRTARQRLLITKGAHPLGYLGAWRHPDTRGLAYERSDAAGRDLTCGSCVHRVLLGAGNRTVPKCDAAPVRLMSGSVASDVRAWWPACTLWEAKP